jgi:DNA topoisomerase I
MSGRARRAELSEHRRRTVVPPAPEVVESARAAGLRYVNDGIPGFSRRRKGKKTFAYFDADGQAITDPALVARIRSLAIPPAWQEVWICPSENGHMQATGIDAKGRKQYRYHPRFRQVRDRSKYEHIIDFAQALPAIRGRVEADLSLPGLQRDKVLAAVVRLLETTLIRVGNEEYAKENHSYGLTTLLQRHVDVTGAHIHFRFRGKSGVKHDIDLDDARLAEIVRQCHELPGQELFQYLTDSGDWHDVDSADVNDYLHEIAGEEFTAKDFRTWSGTVLAATALAALSGFTSTAQAKKNIVRAVESVAHKLGNTKAVCRKCYVHPAVFEGYLDGTLVESLNGVGADADSGASQPAAADLRPDERRVLTFLQHRSASQADIARATTATKKAA